MTDTTIDSEEIAKFAAMADEWRKSRDTGINYMVLAERPSASRVSSSP